MERNIIVFGSTGAGKSSVVNMLDGSSQAEVSNAAKGMTFSNTCYKKIIKGMTVNVFDTVGLNEAIRGTVSPREAVEGLYNLTRQLDDGISLLVFVMRAPRITAVEQQNYQMFYEILCDKKVPIVIVITGLEYEEHMDEWWPANEEAFDLHEMLFHGHACITATRGISNETAQAYEQSKLKVEELIGPLIFNVLWKVPQRSWFASIAQSNVWAKVLGPKYRFLAPELDAALASYGAILGRDAVAVRHIGRRSRTAEPIPSIVVFGRSQTENISVINMLPDNSQPIAIDSVRPMSNTTEYKKTIRGSTFNIYESTSEKLTRDVIEQLFHFISQLTSDVNLLVLVVQASDLGDLTLAAQNYKVLHGTFFNKRVPIIIIVTGLESGQDMDGWWVVNKVAFDQHEMYFQGCACITTTDEMSEQEEMKEKMEQLIWDSYSRVPWRMQHMSSLSAIVWSYGFGAWLPGYNPLILAPELRNALASYGGLSDREAVAISNKIERTYLTDQVWQAAGHIAYVYRGFQWGKMGKAKERHLPLGYVDDERVGSAGLQG